nr:hypothetical protein CFP56_70543 [Quercus suber]
MALYFGNSDRAQQAAAVLTALSAVGSMISVTYTCVRVEQCIGWSNILPWSLLWRLASPVRIPWWRMSTIMHQSRPGHRPQTFEIPRGTPQGGVLLGWLTTCIWICISASFHTYADAIKYTSGFLVYGHFFASAAVAYGFLMGAFQIGPYFRHNPERHVPTSHWNPGSPSSLLFPKGREWFGHILLGGSLFGLSVVVIICGLVYASGRAYFYVIIAMMAVACLYWSLFVYQPVANMVLGTFGLVVSQATHGIDDREDAERACDECSVYEHRQPHRHAQDGYETYNRIGVKNDSEVGRFFMKTFGGPVEQQYNLPRRRSGSVVNVAEANGSARHSQDDRPGESHCPVIHGYVAPSEAQLTLESLGRETGTVRPLCSTATLTDTELAFVSVVGMIRLYRYQWWSRGQIGAAFRCVRGRGFGVSEMVGRHTKLCKYCTVTITGQCPSMSSA